MSPPTTPYSQLTDPNDLALSDEDEGSRSSAEATRSPSTLGDVDPLISRSVEDEKTQQSTNSSQGRLQIIGWMIANTMATVGSVFINKTLFSTSMFRYDQLSFAAYHFAITSILLCILSNSRFRYFEARRVKIVEMLPLSISLCMSVIVSNLSLAYSSIVLYQLVRALLTPCVAAINCFFYKAVVPRVALMAVVPMCMGIAMVTYYYPGSSGDDSSLPMTTKGAIFAFAGVTMTALHTVWMGVFQRSYQLDATQLLLNQAPLGSLVLLYVIPWADTLPVWNELPKNTWRLLLLSGACTCVLDVSRMHMIAEVGPVSSIIFENVKTIFVIAIGACIAGDPAIGASAPLIVLALIGVVVFSIATLEHKT